MVMAMAQRILGLRIVLALVLVFGPVMPVCADSADSRGLKHSSSDVASALTPIDDKWAVVIGIKQFRNPQIPPLKYPAKDADDFAKFLVEKCNFADDHVLVLTDQQATKQTILDALGDTWLPTRAAANDLVLLYASSHGSPSEIDIRGDNFLIAHDTDPDKLFSTGIALSDLVATITKRTGCKRVLLVLDACSSGAANVESKGLVRTKNFDVSALAGTGQIVISSSDWNQRSWESKRYENGVFTRQLISALQLNGPTTKIAEAFQHLKEQVSTEVASDRQEQQTPVLKSKWVGDDLAVGMAPVNPRKAPSAYANTIAAQFELAWKYFKGIGVEQNYDKAFEIYEKLANQGDAKAQYNLGYFHQFGHGVPQNHVKAANWFRKSAEQGDSNAQIWLGHSYAEGLGIPKSEIIAVQWYEKAAKQGNAQGQVMLGRMYEMGRGVKKDPSIAVEWFQKAANKGDANALSILGDAYFYGRGVPKSYTKAAEYYRTAAERGDSFGAYSMGWLYEKGLGVEKDPGLAVTWYRQSSERGYRPATDRLRRLKQI